MGGGGVTFANHRLIHVLNIGYRNFYFYFQSSVTHG